MIGENQIFDGPFDSWFEMAPSSTRSAAKVPFLYDEIS